MTASMSFFLESNLIFKRCSDKLFLSSDIAGSSKANASSKLSFSINKTAFSDNASLCFEFLAKTLSKTVMASANLLS
ncbi:MAG: hypothetical protein U1E01_01130, partial [Methylicorpusculum sp.]